VGDHQAGGGEAILGAQPFAGAVEVGVDGVLGNAQQASDLLRRQVLIDQPQTLALAVGQPVEGLAELGRGLAHFRHSPTANGNLQTIAEARPIRAPRERL